MRATVLSAIFASYDTPKPPVRQTVDTDWLLVTDDPALEAPGWQVVYEPARPGMHPNRQAKYPKMMPWCYTDAPASVWVDASFQVVSPTFVADVLAYAHPIGQFEHPWRSCAPGDQMVETVKHGRVRIDELVPGVHRLVSYWPLHRRIVVGHNWHGYDFERATRDFTGDLVVMTTDEARVRVTPDHWVAARWTSEASEAFCVYLMRRGSWWRIGKAQLHHGNARRFGPGYRVREERADEMWLIGVYETNGEALLAEQFYSAAYGITQAIFCRTKAQKWQIHVTHEMLKDLHERLAAQGSGERARQLLSDLGLDLNQPLWSRGSNNFPGLGAAAALKIRASNLVSGWMEVPVANGTDLTWRRVTTTREPVIRMPVYSLNVEPYHAYVGDGQVLYNCLFDEAVASAPIPKYAGEPITEQVAHYRKLGRPQPNGFGLWATGVIAWRHDNARVRLFGERWLQECHRWSFQDQVSEPFVLHELGLRPASLPGMHLANAWVAYQGSGNH